MNNVLSKRPGVELAGSFGPESGTPTVIDINEATTYQTIDGFGCALTDNDCQQFRLERM